MRKVVKDMNSNDLNNQTINTNMSENSTIQTNNVTSSEPTTIKSIKKKKYWLIPLIVFAAMIISTIIVMLPIILRFIFNIDVSNNVFLALIRLLMTFIMGLCALGFIPSIIVAIVLSLQNKQK